MMILASHIESVYSYQASRIFRYTRFSTFKFKDVRHKPSSSYTSTCSIPISMSASSQSIEISNDIKRHRIGIIGGGASGMFAATAAADASRRSSSYPCCDVVVFEGTSKTMSKVRISGGG